MHIRLIIIGFALALMQNAWAEATYSKLPSYAPNQTNKLRFKGYAEAPKFSVKPRKEGIKHYPCAQCHQFMEPNPKVRELSSPHPVELNHGEGRLWCLVCHHMEDRNKLRTQLNDQVDYNDAHLVCGGCHAVQQKDWYFGAHGKRVRNWQGKRELLNCSECHNPHEPVIKPRRAKPPPPVRAGLERNKGRPHTVTRTWERHVSKDKEKSHAYESVAHQ